MFGVLSPVARLYDKRDVTDLFSEQEIRAIVEPGSPHHTSALLRKRLENIEHEKPSSIEVGVCERAEVRDDDLVDIGGLPFALGVPLARLLEGCTIDFKNGQFDLLDQGGASHTLTSLLRMRANG